MLANSLIEVASPANTASEDSFTDDPAFSEFKTDLEKLKGGKFTETRSRIEIRSAVEELVRNRTGRSHDYPWLQERLNPPPLDIPPCHSIPLDTEQKQGLSSCEAKVQFGLVPYAPPREYFLHPPKETMKPQTEVELLAVDMLKEFGLDQLENIASDDPYYEEALQRWKDPEKKLQIYATWAKDTAVDGADILRTSMHIQSLSQAFHTGNLDPADNRKPAGINENTMLLPMPPDIKLVTDRATTDLKRLLDEAGANVHMGKTTSGDIPDYRERTNHIYVRFRNAIDSARWHIEHGNFDDPETEEMLKTTLQDAYSGFNLAIQTCNYYYDKGFGGPSTSVHDISILVGGFKIDQTADGRYGQFALTTGSADYFDAFMAVSQFWENMYSYQDYATMTIPDLQKHEGYRPIFGHFNAARETIRQQLTTMAVLCLRMPRYQQEIYADIIKERFNLLMKDLDIYEKSPEPILFIPSAGSANVHYPELYPFDLTAQSDVIKANYLYPMTQLVDSSWYPGLLKNKDGRIQVLNKIFVNGNEPSECNDFAGFGSSGAWIDEQGFVHPGAESKTYQSMFTLAAEKAKSWLDRLAESRSLLPAGRLGKELAATIDELLNKDQETGSVKSVSKFAATLERLLGRKPNQEESDFVSLLQELGMINSESTKLNSLNPDELKEMLENIRSGKADVSDLDEGSVILLLISTTGVVPRELLVELVFKTYENLNSVLTLEAVTAIENLENKRRFSFLGMTGEKNTPIMTVRESIKEFLDVRREKDGYDPKKDPEFRKLAEEAIKKVTGILYRNKRYDATMRSSLIAVLTAKEQEELVARCSVDGELLTTILKFISPELATYYASTYGPESSMTFAKWYQWLGNTDESGAESHGYNQTDWPEDDGQKSIRVADATGNLFYLLNPHDFAVEAEITKQMKFGEATNQQSGHIFHEKRQALGLGVHGGSHMLSELALESGQIDYAEVADPDSPRVLISIILNKDLPQERRAQALDKIMILEPQRLAMSLKADHGRGFAAQRLETIVQLGISSKKWGAATVAANILGHAKFFGKEVNESSKRLYQIIIQKLVTQPDAVFENDLKSGDRFFTQFDTEAIKIERQKYLARLEQSKKTEASTEDIIKALREANNILDRELNEVASQIREKAQELEREDLENEAKEQAESPTLGYKATNQYGKEISERELSLVEKTRSKEQNPAIDPVLFETVNAETSAKALQTAITGADGKLLSGNELEKRLQLIQGTITKIAFDVRLKQLTTGKSNEVNVFNFEQSVTAMALAIHSGLEKSAKQLGVTLPTYTPKAELPEVPSNLFLHE